MAAYSKISGETDKSYNAFLVYLRADPSQRSAKYVERNYPATMSSIVRWSRRHMWRQRAQDADVARSKREAEAQELVDIEAAKQHITRSRRLQDIAMGEIERYAEFSQSQEIPVIKPETATKMLTDGFKMERLALGKSTESTESTVIKQAPLTAAEIEKYDALIDSKIDEELIINVDV